MSPRHLQPTTVFLQGTCLVHLSGIVKRRQEALLIEECAAKGIKLKQIYDAETLSGGMSLVASTGGFTLLPTYVQNALIPAVVARPLHGEVPTIDLVMGYNKSNTLPLLKKFLLRANELAARGPRVESSLRTLNDRNRRPKD